MEDYQIDPGWRGEESRSSSRSRAVSPHTLGFSIAAHLLLAGLIVAVLLRLGASRPAHPGYLVTRIVDRLPGAESGQRKLGPAGAVGRPSASAAAAAAPQPKPATQHARSIRSWMRNRIDSAKIEARKDESAVDDATRTIAKMESAAIEMKPAAAAKLAVAGDGGESPGARGPATGGGSEGGDGGGGGSGTDQEAHAAYGSAPTPDYPIGARQMEQQGIVMLRVLVSADGAAQRVEIAHSSGFQLLDDAALETVRERWRFVPAMRAGAAVESWVTVPIRFALTEADAND